MSNLNAVSDGLRVLRTILVERRGARRRRARRRASGALVAVAPARGLIRVEKTLVRMLFALPSIDRARPCVHRGQRRSQRVQRSWHCQLLAAGPPSTSAAGTRSGAARPPHGWGRGWCSSTLPRVRYRYLARPTRD